MDVEQDWSFGAHLRRRREAANLTQEELAERTGLTANAIGALERGERRRPHPHTVRVLADALTLTVADRDRFLVAARASASALKLAAAPPRPELPIPPTSLIGRERELTAICSLLAREGERLITLVGPGGVGKTHLALDVAAQLEDHYPDRVAFVALAPVRDADLLLLTIAQVLGLRAVGGQPVRDLLHGYLRDRHLLLVLDNLEHLLDAAPEVAALLIACPAVTILATSRAPLQIRGEREYRVEPLAVPDPNRAPDLQAIVVAPATTLFVERATAVNPSFILTRHNAAAVAAICWRLGGLPLALELAAAQARFLGPAELLSRLDRALSVAAVRDLPGRQRTMRATIDWSHELLTAPARVLFRRLAVFAGGFTLAAAEAVGAADEVGSEDVLALLAMLVEQSLVTAEDADGLGVRYHMLEPIRQYALERLAASGEEDQIRDRHVAYILSLAEWAGSELPGPGQAACLDRLGPEHDNLRVALARLLARGDAENAAALSWQTWWYWYIRGHFSEGREWMERILSDGSALSPRGRARVLAVLAVLAFAQADFDGVVANGAESAKLARLAGDLPVLAFALLSQANGAIGRGHGSQANVYATESASICRTLEDWTGLGLATAVEFHSAAVAGDLARATKILTAADEHLRRGGAHWNRAYLLILRAEAAHLTGDLPRAVRCFRESIALSARIGDIILLLFGLTGLASALAQQGDGVRAARLFGAVATLQERTGTTLQNPASQSRVERNLATLRAQLDAESLAQAWAEGRALSDEQVLAEAEAGAAELAADSVTAPAVESSELPGGLSGREVEVLRLVAAGLSNGVIAERLFLSENTVRAHLRRIYDKLDLQNRAEATHFALKHGIA